MIPSESSERLQQVKQRLVQRPNRQALQRMPGSSDAPWNPPFPITNSPPEWRFPDPPGTPPGSPEATRRLYGMDALFEHTRTYARQCLLARRMVERGVRFVELTIPWWTAIPGGMPMGP